MSSTMVSADSIVQEITIHAPAERIFEALTNPKELLYWWGVQGKFQAVQVECDVRPGGKWKMRVRNSCGSDAIVAGEYRRIERPRLLVYTWVREQEDGVETSVRWDVEERSGGTEVRVTHSGLTSYVLRARNSGWPIVVNLLQAYVQREPISESKTRADFRLPTASKWDAPRAVADSGSGTIIATAGVAAPPERVFQALTTNEVERWWGHSAFYRMTDWSADLRVLGQWSVVVRFAGGSTNGGSGEFAELDKPRKIVMTRKFDRHPLLGTRETTITYRLEPVGAGTRVTVREEGFIGRSEAAYGNAEHWERVLGWLNAYMISGLAEEDFSHGKA